jgi:DNA-binding NarL/FixJ family response regulator
VRQHHRKNASKPSIWGIPLHLTFGPCHAITAGHGELKLSGQFPCLIEIMKRPRILLADDHALTLESISAVLSPHYEIAGSVADGRALVEAAMRLKPDLIVLDITMPHLSGVLAARQIKTSQPGIKLLFVTMHSSSAYVRAALEAGGTGYVLKSVVREELLHAVQSVLRGCIYISGGISIERLEGLRPPASAANHRLSKRELETLQLVAEGRTVEEIARAMNISPKKVAFHRGNIKRKLGLKTTSELTKHAIELGLIP